MGQAKELSLFFVALACSLVLSGCSSKHYRQKADRQAYRIIQQAQETVHGQTNEFTIETETSGRDPEDISPEELIEDRAAEGSRLLTLEDALAVAERSSRAFQAQRESLFDLALTLSNRRHAFSVIPFLGSSPRFDRLSNGDKVGSVDTEGGLRKNFKTGGNLTVRLFNGLTRYYSGDPGRAAASTISINLTQPLLRGFGKYNPEYEALTQAERNVIYGVRNFSFFQNDYALTIVSSYFNLLAQKDVVRNRYTNYLSRVQATERLERRFEGERERAIDVDQARQAELSARNNYINSVANYRNSLDAFKLEIGLPIGEQIHLDDKHLYELQEHGLTPAQLDPDFAYRLALERQYPTLNAIDRFEDAKRRVKVAANNLKADLDIVADARLRSEGETDYFKFNADEWEGGIGAVLNLPLDRHVEGNNYRGALIDFEAEVRNLTLTLDRLKDSIARGLRNLEQRQQTFEIQQGALQVANRRVAAATQLIQAGRAEVRDLVEAQDAQINAQNAVTSALVSYQEALLDLMLDIGVLETESPKFWLKDHLASVLQEAPGDQPAPEVDSLVPPHQVF